MADSNLGTWFSPGEGERCLIPPFDHELYGVPGSGDYGYSVRGVDAEVPLQRYEEQAADGGQLTEGFLIGEAVSPYVAYPHTVSSAWGPLSGGGRPATVTVGDGTSLRHFPAPPGGRVAEEKRSTDRHHIPFGGTPRVTQV